MGATGSKPPEAPAGEADAPGVTARHPTPSIPIRIGGAPVSQGIECLLFVYRDSYTTASSCPATHMPNYGLSESLPFRASQ